jgi:hypothetical protein
MSLRIEGDNAGHGLIPRLGAATEPDARTKAKGLDVADPPDVQVVTPPAVVQPAAFETVITSVKLPVAGSAARSQVGVTAFAAFFGRVQAGPAEPLTVRETASGWGALAG